MCDVCGERHAEDSHVFKYIDHEAIDDNLIDPITMAPIFNGVQLSCQHAFSSHSITLHLKRDIACPTCRVQISSIKPVTRLFRIFSTVSR